MSGIKMDDFLNTFFEQIDYCLEFIPAWVWAVFGIVVTFRGIISTTKILIGSVGLSRTIPDVLEPIDVLDSSKFTDTSKEDTFIAKDDNVFNQ